MQVRHRILSLSFPPLSSRLPPFDRRSRENEGGTGRERAKQKYIGKGGRGLTDVRTRSRLSASIAGIAHAGADSITTEGRPLKGLGRRLEDLEGERVECEKGA